MNSRGRILGSSAGADNDDNSGDSVATISFGVKG